MSMLSPYDRALKRVIISVEVSTFVAECKSTVGTEVVVGAIEGILEGI